MDEAERFRLEVEERIRQNGRNELLRERTDAWLEAADTAKYEYNFTWLGRPIIQYPQDLVALQEIIWRTRPDVIVETGIAHGGSTILYASLLELLGGERKVVAVDHEIRAHNRVALEAHPLFHRVTLVEGSSLDGEIVARVRELTHGRERVMVCLDANHTHAHVLAELELYSPLVRRGNYVIVFDTSIETIRVPDRPDRPWGKGNNPKTAVVEFLRTNDRFAVDERIEHQLLVTSAPGGFLLCIKD